MKVSDTPTFTTPPLPDDGWILTTLPIGDGKFRVHRVKKELVGATGAGVPAGGSAGMFLKKSGAGDFQTIWDFLSASDFPSQAAGLVLASPSGGAGAPEFRSLVLSDLPAGVGTGTVTSAAVTVPAEFSVSGSPITTSGTFAITKATQTANLVYAGPTSGGAAEPTFRAIVAADLPAGTGTVTSAAVTVPAEFLVSGSPITTSGTFAITKATQTANLVYAGPTSGGAAEPTFRAMVAADLPAGTGTVTSAAVTVPAEFLISGSPITTSGTFAITKATQTANLVYAGPTSGGAAEPTFRAMVAADLPAGTGTGTVTSAGLAMPAEFSVAGTPITTAGTLTVTKVSQTANLVYAGPTSGGAAEPTFRAMVAADLPAGTGTVTSAAVTVPAEFSVSGSPITTSGTFAITKATQTANLVYAGPTSGGAAEPTFRAIVAADLPAGTGTVTSVAMTAPSGFTVSGSPVTTTGTLAVTLASQSAKTFLASPTASSGAPTFRALVYGDVPEIFEFAISDETTAITTGTAKLTWRAPRAMTITAVRASLSTASSSGIPTVDINENGTTILSTKLTIDANEKTSTTAATPAVISDSAIADDAEITFDIDVAGTGAAGLKVKIYAI